MAITHPCLYRAAARYPFIGTGVFGCGMERIHIASPAMPRAIVDEISAQAAFADQHRAVPMAPCQAYNPRIGWPPSVYRNSIATLVFGMLEQMHFCG